MGNKTIVDERGRQIQSIGELARILNKPRQRVSEILLRNGKYECGGHTYMYADIPVINEGEPVFDPMWEKLQQRYSREELEMLLKGEGLQDKKLRYPKICLHGRHHKIGVIADGHLGSKYSPVEWHLEAFKEFEKEGCECVLHCGDLVEGLTPRRVSTQIYELSHIGYKAQKELALEVFSQCSLPVYAISGNHDAYFNEFAGANIVEDICNEMPNMTYLGADFADINIDGAVIRLGHGNDGSSYAYSYKLQKVVEALTAGKKPNIYLQGHYHKFNYCYVRGVHAVSCPSLQMQTPFMAGRKLEAHTGFLVIEFDVMDSSVKNFQLRLYPYYG